MINSVAHKIQGVIEKYQLIEPGESVLTAVSGGPDSVCLMHVLNLLGYKTFAFHLNHMLRGEEAKRDEEYVRELCLNLGICFRSVSVDVNEFSKTNKMSLEEAGRTVRYLELEAYAKEVGASKIAVGHNKNDQVETFIMNIIRGTGLSGLSGINHKNGNIIRPLLDIGREEVEEYCAENKLAPISDSSNGEDVFTRNKVRLNLIPYVNEMFDADIVKNIYKTISHLKDDEEILKKVQKENYEKCLLKSENLEVSLDVEKLKGCEDAILKRVLRNAIVDLQGHMHDIGSVHVEQIVRLVRIGQSGRRLRLPGNIKTVKQHNILKIYKGEDEKRILEFEKKMAIPGITELAEHKCLIEAAMIENNEKFKGKNNSMTQYLDYEKLKDKTIIVRNRREGDTIKTGGTKKLKKYFIDSKVPESDRDHVLLIASGQEIIWAIGHRVSDKYKVDENSAAVLKLVCRRY